MNLFFHSGDVNITNITVLCTEYAPSVVVYTIFPVCDNMFAVHLNLTTQSSLSSSLVLYLRTMCKINSLVSKWHTHGQTGVTLGYTYWLIAMGKEKHLLMVFSVCVKNTNAKNLEP